MKRGLTREGCAALPDLSRDGRGSRSGSGSGMVECESEIETDKEGESRRRGRGWLYGLPLIKFDQFAVCQLLLAVY